jgi:5-methylcytosine-specific restriction endonuclease McrA
MSVQVEEKWCPRCSQHKSIAFFSRNKRRSDGLASWCKLCSSEYGKQYQKENRAKLTVKAKARREADPEGQHEYWAAYYQKNREKILVRSQQWVRDNPERRRDHSRNSARKLQRERPEIHRATERRRRARKAAVAEQFTARMAAFVRLFWDDTCALCGRLHNEEERAYPIDHWLPLSGGHALSMDNAVLLCDHCNASKSKRQPRKAYSTETVERIESLLQLQSRLWQEGMVHHL